MSVSAFVSAVVGPTLCLEVGCEGFRLAERRAAARSATTKVASVQGVLVSVVDNFLLFSRKLPSGVALRQRLLPCSTLLCTCFRVCLCAGAERLVLQGFWYVLTILDTGVSGGRLWGSAYFDVL